MSNAAMVGNRPFKTIFSEWLANQMKRKPCPSMQKLAISFPKTPKMVQYYNKK